MKNPVNRIINTSCIMAVAFSIIGASPASAEVNRIADKSAKIALIGGGVSGLAAAFELNQLGYRDVTLFKADDEVGGKVSTYIHPETGAPYEVGAIVQSDSFDNIYRLVQKTGYASGPKDWLKAYPAKAVVVNAQGEQVSTFIDFHQRREGSDRRYGLQDDLIAGPGFLDLLSDIGPVGSSGIFKPGFDKMLCRVGDPWGGSPLFSSFLESTDEFMKHAPTLLGRQDFSAVRGRFSLFFNMTGYGFTSEVPALYHLKFMRMVAKVGLEQVLQMGSGMTNAKAGYQKFLVYLKQWLIERGVNIRLGHRITHMERPSESDWSLGGQRRRLTVATQGETQDEDFDVVIAATPPDATKRYLNDASPDENEMLDRVKVYNFVTTIFEVEKNSLLKWRKSTAFVEDYALNASVAIPEAHVIGLYNNDGSNVFTAYQFAPSTISDEALNAALTRDVTALGGKVEKVLVTKQWRDYFPHYSTEDLKSDGGQFLSRITGLQGRRNTLFLMANYEYESTEHLAGFSRYMIHRFFQ